MRPFAYFFGPGVSDTLWAIGMYVFSFRFACSTYLLLLFFCCKRMARRLEEMICQLKMEWNGRMDTAGVKKVFNAANVCQSFYHKIVVFLYFVVSQ